MSLTDIEKEKQGSAGDGASGGGSAGVSASLTPTIWNKTIPYDGETFHLEYMDLDEFLLENGIPVTLEEEPSKSQGAESQASDSPATVPQMPEEKEKDEENKQESSSVSDETEQEVTETAEGERKQINFKL